MEQNKKLIEAAITILEQYSNLEDEKLIHFVNNWFAFVQPNSNLKWEDLIINFDNVNSNGYQLNVKNLFCIITTNGVNLGINDHPNQTVDLKPLIKIIERLSIISKQPYFTNDQTQPKYKFIYDYDNDKINLIIKDKEHCFQYWLVIKNHVNCPDDQINNTFKEIISKWVIDKYYQNQKLFKETNFDTIVFSIDYATQQRTINLFNETKSQVLYTIDQLVLGAYYQISPTTI